MAPPDVTEVEPRLFIGAEDAVEAAVADAALGVTHLVSFGYPPPSFPWDDDDADADADAVVRTLKVELEDDDDGDLLSQLPDVLAFISDGLRGGGAVLVHCHAGVSRSAAALVAHLMRARDLDPDAALALLRAKHARASPNDGFIAQLELWNAMDRKLSASSEAYRLYSLAKTARRREHDGYVAATDVRPDPGAAAEGPPGVAAAPFSGVAATTLVGPKDGGGAEAGAMIRCRRCRRLLARGTNRTPHAPGEGVDAFSWRKRRRGGGGGDGAGGAGMLGASASASAAPSPSCQNIFLEPLAWMRGVEDASVVEKKLCCPKCETKVGHFNWSGSRCSCGAWVTPSFYVQSGKVDVMPYAT